MKYLDTNIIGYAIEAHEKYGAACARILEDIETGKLKVACSVLVFVEILGVLRKLNKELMRLGKKEIDVRANMDAILSLPITWLDVNPYIIKMAAEYNFTASAQDQVHAATMEVHGIYEIISADADFDKIDFVSRNDPLEY